MDSSNSGSFQSSSGGGDNNNDEYDSRTQSISSFFNPNNNNNNDNNNNSSTNFNTSNNINQLLQVQVQPAYHQLLQSTPTDNTFYNPTIQDPANSPWTGTIRSDHPNLPSRFANGFKINPNPNPSMDNSQTKTAHQIGVTIKNPKKRTRASRRAPTTVLTTDTTNFRQMVQEFTGIPTAPFTTAPFSRRLDLFNPNPLRPSANNITTTITTSTVESGTTTTTTSPGNYQFSPCNNMNNFQKQPCTFLDLQNPMFSFQSLLQNSLPCIPNRSSTWGDQKDTFQAVNAIPNNTLNINGGSKFNSAIENHVLTAAAAATADHLQPSTSTSTSTSWIN